MLAISYVITSRKIKADAVLLVAASKYSAFLSSPHRSMQRTIHVTKITNLRTRCPDAQLKMHNALHEVITAHLHMTVLRHSRHFQHIFRACTAVQQHASLKDSTSVMGFQGANWCGTTRPGCRAPAAGFETGVDNSNSNQHVTTTLALQYNDMQYNHVHTLGLAEPPSNLAIIASILRQSWHTCRHSPKHIHSCIHSCSQWCQILLSVQN